VKEGSLQSILRRQAQGMPSSQRPMEAGWWFGEQGEECEDPEAQSCPLWIARALQPAPAALASSTLATPLWEVWYGPEVARDLEVEASEWARWISAGRSLADKGARLRSLVFSRHHEFRGSLWRTDVGDPSFAWARGRSSPWTSALAAQLLGELSGIPVEVSALGDGVVVRMGASTVGLGPCATDLPIPPQPGAIWEGRSILAQATLDAVGVALRRGDTALAHRLLALAERLDPLGVDGARDVVHQQLPVDTSLQSSYALGGFVFSTPPPPQGAEAERKWRATLWKNALSEWGKPANEHRCPTVLGP